MTRRKKALAGLGVLLVLTLGLATYHPSVQDLAMERVVHARVTRDAGDLYGDDALHVLLCGSGSPLPSPERAQACVVVFAGGRGYLFDIGTGGAENLALWRVETARIEHVFLTHFHSDHFGDLGEVNLAGWVAGRPGSLHVHGPEGVTRIVEGTNEAYALDSSYRVAHHSAELLPPGHATLQSAPFVASVSGSVVHSESIGDDDEWGLVIRAFLVDHSPVAPAVGYRIDYRGRSVVLSGDTGASPHVVAAAQHADLLLHEALAPHMINAIERAAASDGQSRIARIMADIPDYHTSPVAAAGVANEADVRRLVLYHLVPSPPNSLAERVFLRGVSEVRPDVTLAQDGLLLSLPANSDSILERQL